MLNGTKKATVTVQSKTAAQKNNIQVQHNIICNGQPVTKEFLAEVANKLTKANDQLAVIGELISFQLCSKDAEMGQYFLKASLPKVLDALNDLEEEYQQAADKIVPD